MNRIVVISGGSQGLGRELMEMFNKNGDTAVCLSRTNKNNDFEFIECDVSNEESVKNAASIIKERYKRVDILINNAGKGISGATELLPTEKIKEVIDTDYLGALYLSRSLLPLMKEKSKIVNISSACAIFALPFRGVYCSAKSAMNMLSFSMRMELYASGVRVVCVCPGDVRTTFTENRIKYFDTNYRYGTRIKESADKIDLKQHKRMDQTKVAKKLYKIADRKNKALYIVGFKYKVLYFFKRILPENFFIKMTNKKF